MKKLGSADVTSPKLARKFCGAYWIGDGFDTYATGSDLTSGAGAFGGWKTSLGTSITTQTRFGIGRASQGSSGGANSLGFYKDGFGPSSTVFAAVAMYQLSVLGGSNEQIALCWFDGTPVDTTLLNGNTNCQIVITFRSDGAIVVRRGASVSTVIATFTGAFVANSYDHWQFKIVIHSSAGEVHVRKNGAASDTFSATGLNTQFTGNSTASAVGVAQYSGGTIQDIDDLVFYDDAGSTAFSDWVGDIRCIQLPAERDTAQKDLTTFSTGSLALSFGSGVSSNAGNADTLYVARAVEGFTMTQGGLLSSLTATFNAGFTGKARIGVYLTDGDVSGFTSDNKPGHLIGYSDEVTNPTSTQVFTFSSPLAIDRGFKYVPAILTDAAFNFHGGTKQFNIYTTGQSYVGGFPSSLIGVTEDSSAINGFLNFTATLDATNAGLCSDYQRDDGATYVTSAVVGDYDLYDVGDLFYTPAAILGVNLRMVACKSDAGARGVKIAGKSGATAFESAEFSPLTTFQNMVEFYALDPDTGLTWSASGVNALQVGPKVSS